MNTAWLVYLVAAAGVWLSVIYGLHKLLPTAHTLLLGLVLLAILVTPVAVPETGSVAPAWLAAIYETLFGSAELASRAVRPLFWSLGLALVPSAAFVIWRFAGSGPARVPATNEES